MPRKPGRLLGRGQTLPPALPLEHQPVRAGRRAPLRRGGLPRFERQWRDPGRGNRRWQRICRLRRAAAGQQHQPQQQRLQRSFFFLEHAPSPPPARRRAVAPLPAPRARLAPRPGDRRCLAALMPLQPRFAPQIGRADRRASTTRPQPAAQPLERPSRSRSPQEQITLSGATAH